MLRLRRKIGKREILIFSFQEINQQFETQQFQLLPASRWADRLREIKLACTEKLELRNRLFQEDMQGIAKKLKNREVFVAKN